MRKRAVVISVLLAAVLAGADEKETLEQLRARAESASGADRAKLFVEVARRQLKEADDLYEAGDVERARLAVDGIALSAERAGEAASQSGKRLKDTEVALRKISKRLSDMRRSLSFEEHAALDKTVERLENVRTELLTSMFSRKKKS